MSKKTKISVRTNFEEEGDSAQSGHKAHSTFMPSANKNLTQDIHAIF